MEKFLSWMKEALENSSSVFVNAALAKKELEGKADVLQTRDGSSLFAAIYPKKVSAPRFAIYAAHLDSPCLKIKPRPVTYSGGLALLETEVYGGAIDYSFFDRPLYLSGRVIGKDLRPRLIESKEPFAYIPSLAIHYGRDVNSSFSVDPSLDLRAVISSSLPSAPFSFERYLLSLCPEAGEILGFDLYLVVKEKAKSVGLNSEFCLSPRLDDLSGAYAGVYAFANSPVAEEDLIKVLVLFSGEEIGSSIYSGAAGDLLSQGLKQVASDLGFDLAKALPRSCLCSSDAAHAGHPNKLPLEDQCHPIRMGKGVALKYSASSAYSTSGLTGAYAKSICLDAGIPFQEYSIRSDLRSGSTLANISNSQVSIPSFDIGVPLLSMHSAVESCAYLDLGWMELFASSFFSNLKPMGE